MSASSKLRAVAPRLAGLVVALLGLAALELSAPARLDDLKDSWREERDRRSEEIVREATELFEREKEALAEVAALARRRAVGDRFDAPPNAPLVNDRDDGVYGYRLFDDAGDALDWRGNLPVAFDSTLRGRGERCFFADEPLEAWLVVVRRVELAEESGVLVVGKLFERRYRLRHEKFERISFREALAERFETDVEIEYGGDLERARDGRWRGFRLRDERGDPIATVAFAKPTRDEALADRREVANDWGAILTFLAALFALSLFVEEFARIRGRLAQFAVLAAALAAARLLLLKLEIPSRFIDGPLVDPKYFSSAFGEGLAKSPLETLVSVGLFLVLALWTFHAAKSFALERRNPNRALFFVAAAFALVFVPVGLRGFAAAMKSALFDSSVRYFREPELFSDPFALALHGVFLALGLATVSFASAALVAPFGWLPDRASRRRRAFGAIAAALALYWLVYLWWQDHPLLTPEVAALAFVVVVAAAGLALFYRSKTPAHALVNTALGSIAVAAMMNFFHSSLERESLVRTAHEVNRHTGPLLEYLARETLTEIETSSATRRAYETGESYEAAAFLAWNRAPVSDEPFDVAITFYDPEGERLGGFDVGAPEDSLVENALRLRADAPTTRLAEGADAREIAYGAAPVKRADSIVGYAAVVVQFDRERFVKRDVPEFLAPPYRFANDVVNLENLGVFVVRGAELVETVGELAPSIEIRRAVSDAAREKGEAWLALEFNRERYIVYALEILRKGERVVAAVALKERELAWSFFNFFKIFLAHAAFILLFAVVAVAVRWRATLEATARFRTRLLVAFVVVSVAPLVALAAFNRANVSEKNAKFIRNALEDRAVFLESDVAKKLTSADSVVVRDRAEYVAKATGMPYAVYRDDELLFASYEALARAGLLPERLSRDAYRALWKEGLTEYFETVTIDGKAFNQYYKRAAFKGGPYLVAVNDAFDPVRATFTTGDFDVFLFGVYSFAAALILVVSVGLAESISRPIDRLTAAARSIAHGDLAVDPGKPTGGEIGELIEGVRYMTGELRRNQEDIAALEREAAWKEMARQVAHEIKNPLTPMKLNVQHLQSSAAKGSPKLPSIIERTCETLLNQIETLNRIASEFSQFARMPSLKTERMDAAAAAREVAALFESERINVGVEAPERVEMEGDPSQTKRALVNLVRNAAQAEATRATIRVEGKDDRVEIRVADDGGGVPEDLRERVFQAGFTTKREGMGIGLSMIARYMESVGGSISIEKTGAEGTIFLLFFPKRFDVAR
ncbi:MAG: HAMP domain-containing protein [Ignavibacteriales bacterium]|nr:HAMP domain-containing protein [Ignavibacteriales bacterium]